MTRGFDDRRGWAERMHRDWIEPPMAEYWGVDQDAIQPMFSDADDAVAADQAGGIDAIVRTAGAAPVFVAQRCRPLRRYKSRTYRPDFSLREQTASGDDSEFVRLLDAHRTGRDLPSIYLFGIGASTSRSRCVRDGLDALFWIDTPALFDAIDAGEIDADVNRSGTGELTRYYSLEQLRQHDCVRAEVSGSALQSVYGDNSAVDPDFPHFEPGVKTSNSRLQDFVQSI